jgi:hypothetical protein
VNHRNAAVAEIIGARGLQEAREHVGERPRRNHGQHRRRPELQLRLPFRASHRSPSALALPPASPLPRRGNDTPSRGAQASQWCNAKYEMGEALRRRVRRGLSTASK